MSGPIRLPAIRKLKLEQFEDRLVPATDITLVSGALTVTNGAGEAAQVTISSDGTLVTLQGVNTTFTDSGNNPDITVAGATATITRAAVTAGMSVLMGDGDDTVVVGNGSADNLFNISINGQTGTNRFRINDSTDVDASTYAVSTGAVSRTSGSTITITFSNISQLELSAGTANDTVLVGSTSFPNTINGGAGNDSITVGPLDVIAGSIVVDGDIGIADQLIVDDSTDNGADDYTITTSQVNRVSLSRAVSFSNSETIRLNTGGGADEVGITSTAAGTTTIADLGDANDTITVGNGTDFSNAAGTVSIIGGSGTDRFVADDSNFATPATYSITSTSLTRSGVDIRFDGTLDQIPFDTGSDDNTINLLSLASTTGLTITGGAANDSFAIGNGNLDGLATNVTINGGSGGTDTAEIDDTANPTATTYSVTTGTVVRGGRTVNFGSMDAVTVKAGDGADTIGITATTATTSITVEGGDGDDTINSGRMDNLASPVTANGGNDNDQLNIDDSPDGGGDVYSVTTTQVTRVDQSRAINHSNVENLSLETGSGTDSVTVTSLAPTSTATIDVGDGNDTISIGSGTDLTAVAGLVSITGGNNTDRLILNDSAFSTFTPTYTIETGKVSRAGVDVRYSGAMELIQLTTSNLGSTTNIISLPTNSDVTVTGGTGADAFTVGTSLDAILADVSIVGGAGLDTLSVSDSAETSASDYTVTASTVERGAKVIDFTGINSLELIAGTGSDTITANSSPGDLTVNGGAGADTILVEGATFGGNTSITGGAGNDEITVDGPSLQAGSTNVIDGGANEDSITIAPVPTASAARAITIDGGAPNSPGDELFAKLTAATATFSAVPDGTASFGGAFQSIPYFNIEEAGFDTTAMNVAGSAGDDVVTISQNARGRWVLNQNISGLISALTFRAAFALDFASGTGNDQLIINNPTSGLFAPAVPITFSTGGSTGDTIQVLGGTANSGSFSVGASPSDLAIRHVSGANTQEILVSGSAAINPVQTTVVTSGDFTVYGRTVADSLTLSDGALNFYRGTIAGFTSIDMRNKSSIVLDGGDSVLGSAAGDTFLINATASVTETVTSPTFNVIGDALADVTTVQAVPATRQYTVNPGTGDDLTIIGAGSLTPVQGQGSVSFGSPQHRVLVNDAADGNPNTYNFASNTINRIGAGLITVAPAVPVDVQASTQDDQFNFGAPAQSLNGMSLPIALDGGAGNDSVSVNDQANVAGQTYTVNSNSIVPAAAAPFSFSNVELANLNTSSAADTIRVQSLGTTPISIVAGSGADNVILGPLDALNGQITILAGLGSDTLTVDDSTDSDSNSYSITPTIVSRGALSFTYSTMEVENLVLNAGNGGDNISVLGTSLPTTVTGGNAADLFVVGGPTLSPVQGTLTVDGGVGSDSLQVLDSSEATNQTFNITANVISRSGAAAIAYTSVDSLIVNTGVADDTIVIRSTTATTPVTVNGGTGIDSITVGDAGSLNNIDSAVVVDGGGQNDTLVIDGSAVGAAEDIDIFLTPGLINGINGGGWGVQLASNMGGGITVASGAGDDQVLVASSTPTQLLTVQTNNGADTITLGNTTLDPLTGQVVVQAGAGNDGLIVDDSSDSNANTYRVTATTIQRGGPAFVYSTMDVQSILLIAGDAADTINVDGASVPITVRGGDGSDVVAVGDASGLQAVTSPVVVDGETGNDQLSIQDSGELAGRTYTVNSTQVTRSTASAPITIDYQSFATLQLNATGQADTINVQTTLAATPVTINGNPGNDTVNAGNGGSMEGLDSAVFVNGGGNLDVLNIDGSANTQNEDVEYFVAGTSITGIDGGGWTITLGPVMGGGVNVTTGSGDDQLLAARVDFGENLTFSSGIGNDTITLGNGTLDQISGTVSVNGGVGLNDSLVLNDTLDSNSNSYTISPTTVSRAGTPLVAVTYAGVGIENVVVNGGPQSDTFTVAGLAASIPVTLSGGAGDDSFVMRNLDVIASTVEIDGGLGSDGLIIDDSADADNNLYRVDNVGIARVNTPGVVFNYGTLEGLGVIAGSGADAINVVSTVANTPVTVNGGLGDDVVTIGNGDLSAIVSTVLPQGGSGVDTVEINDSTSPANNFYSVSSNLIERTNGSLRSYNYASGFEFAALRAGNGNDVITANSSASVIVDVLAGGGNDVIDLTFLSGQIIGEGGADTITGDNGDRTYTLTGSDTGTISTILGGTFSEVENLIAGAGNDSFVVANGGSLSGRADGTSGIDLIRGDDAGRDFILDGVGTGTVTGAIGRYSGIEQQFGGTGDDRFIPQASAPISSLQFFNGGSGLDIAVMSNRLFPQTWNFQSPSAIDGYRITGGDSTGSFLSPTLVSVVGELTNMNRLVGTGQATDRLNGLAGVDTNWVIQAFDISTGERSRYSQAGATFIEFDGFERFVGADQSDSFDVSFAFGNPTTGSILIEGGTGTDRVGVTGTSGNDTFDMLKRGQIWSGSLTLFSGVRVVGSPIPVLYDVVERLDVLGGAGDDSFRADPGTLPIPRRRRDDMRIFGAGLRQLLLFGGAGSDRFDLVPDPFNQVNMYVFGDSGSVAANGTIVPLTVEPTDNDVLVMYRLPLRVKANFPVNRVGGRTTFRFDLRQAGAGLNFGTISYANMSTVAAYRGIPPVNDSLVGRLLPGGVFPAKPNESLLPLPR